MEQPLSQDELVIIRRMITDRFAPAVLRHLQGCNQKTPVMVALQDASVAIGSPAEQRVYSGGTPTEQVDVVSAIAGVLRFFESGNDIPVDRVVLRSSSPEVQQLRAAYSQLTGM